MTMRPARILSALALFSALAALPATAQLPDLTSTFISGPSGSAPGDTLDMQFNVSNAGTVSSGTNWSFRWYLSTDNIITTSDVLICGAAGVELPAGTNVTTGTSCFVPVVPQGQYYLGMIMDYLGQTPESNETNNAVASVTPMTICTDGGNEPNGTIATATGIPASYLNFNLYICGPKDHDGYVVFASAGQFISAQISIPGSVDYDLELLDPSGTQLTFSNNGTGQSDSLGFTATYTGNYYIHVFPFSATDFSPGAPYQLRVLVQDPATLMVTPAPPNQNINIARAWEALVAGNAGRMDSLIVVITGATGASWTASRATSAAAWQTLHTTGGTGDGVIRYTPSAASLPPGTYVDTITVTAAAAGNSPQIVVDTLVVVAGVGGVTNNVPATISGAQGSGQFFAITIPSGVTSFSWTMSGGTGDPDMFCRAGGLPGMKQFDFAPYIGGSAESCTYSNPAAGQYLVLVQGFLPFSGVSLVASYTVGAPTLSLVSGNPRVRAYEVQPIGSTDVIPDSATVGLAGGSAASTTWTATHRAAATWLTLVNTGGTGPGALRYNRNAGGLTQGTYIDTITVTAAGATGSPAILVDTFVVHSSASGLANGGSVAVGGAAGSAQIFILNVPAGATNLQFGLSGGSGDADMYVAANRTARLGDNDCVSANVGNSSESCSFPTPASGYYIVMIQGRSAFGTPNLTSSYTAASLALSLSKPAEWHAAPSTFPATGGDSVGVLITGTGAASATWTATHRAAATWNTMTTSGGTGPGMARWTRSSSGLAPSTYIDTITVTSSGQTQVMVDTLVVIAPTSVTSGVAVNGLTGGSGSAQYFVINAAVGTTLVEATTSGGSGGVYLYVLPAPQVAQFQWASASETGIQTNQFTNILYGSPLASPADVYVLVRGSGPGYSGVSLTVTATGPVLSVPSGTYRAAAVSITATRTDSLPVGLSGPGAGTVPWTATHRAAATWNTLTQSSGNGSGFVTWTRSSFGLGVGIYIDTITVTAAAGGSPAINVDTMVIAPAPVGLANGVATTNISGAAGSGQFFVLSAPAQTTLFNATTSGGTGDIQLAISFLNGISNFGRLCFSNTPASNVESCGFGSGPFAAATDVYVFIRGMSAFTGVSLTATASSPPLVQVSPTHKSDTLFAGSGTVRADSATVTISGASAASTAWTATHSSAAGWITLTTAGGTGSGMLRWSRNAAGLAIGTYVDTIFVSAAGSPFGPARLIDTLVVSVGPLTVTLNPASRRDSIGAPVLGTRADSTTVTLSGTGAATATWTATTTAGLTLTNAGATGTAKLYYTRPYSGLAAGLYIDTITVIASGAVGSPARLVDTLIIGGGPLTLAVAPGSRSTVVIQGGTAAVLDSASVTLSGTNSGATTWTATHRAAATWNTLTTAGGTGSGRVRWSRNPTGLAIGAYIDTITVTASGAAGSPARVIDTLFIVGPLTLAVSPTSRRDSMISGATGTKTDSSNVTLTGAGAAGATWAATHRAAATWITLTTAGGTGSGRVRWTRAYTGLAPGTYIDTITVTVAGATGSPARIIDTLVAFNALSVAVSPVGHKDSTFVGLAGTTQDSASVLISGLGQSTTNWTATHRAAATWNTLTTAAGTGTPSKVRWTRNYNGLAAGIYLDTIRVIVAGAAGSPALVLDTLVVFAKPVSTVLEVADGILSGGGGSLTASQRLYLDLQGNRNGQFDLGDFLAYVTANPAGVSPGTIAEVMGAMGRKPTHDSTTHDSRSTGRVRP